MSMPIPVNSYQEYLDYVRANAHATAMENYPRFQYSVFINGSRDEQVVVRADSFDEFARLKGNIAPLLSNGQPSDKEAANGAGESKGCIKCGGAVKYREGVSKKTGKSYKGVFCLNEDCNYAQFL